METGKPLRLAAFRRWVSGILPALGPDAVVAINGKTSRRSGKVDATPLHLVSAFAAGAGLVLGQRATAEKSNEKTAIPQLLATLALDGCIDAMTVEKDHGRIEVRRCFAPRLSAPARAVARSRLLHRDRVGAHDQGQD